MTRYFTFLVIFFILPTVFLWLFYLKTLKKYILVFLLTIFCTFVFGMPWDLLSVRNGVWGYDLIPNIGIWLFGGPKNGLPFEEVIFTLFTPLLIASLTVVLKEKLN